MIPVAITRAKYPGKRLLAALAILPLSEFFSFTVLLVVSGEVAVS